MASTATRSIGTASTPLRGSDRTNSQPNTGGGGAPTPAPVNDFTREERDAIQRCLNLHLGPEYITYRPAPNGGKSPLGKVPYIEGWRALELANETFGFSGWSSSVQDMSVDYAKSALGVQMDQGKDGKFTVGVSAVVRVTIKNGAYHEDVGYGVSDNMKTKGMALEKAKKEAVTDAIKRALRMFGNSLGNSVYDKEFIKHTAARNGSVCLKGVFDITAGETFGGLMTGGHQKRDFDEENMRHDTDAGPKRFMAGASASPPGAGASAVPMPSASVLVAPVAIPAIVAEPPVLRAMEPPQTPVHPTHAALELDPADDDGLDGLEGMLDMEDHEYDDGDVDLLALDQQTGPAGNATAQPGASAATVPRAPHVWRA